MRCKKVSVRDMLRSQGMLADAEGALRATLTPDEHARVEAALDLVPFRWSRGVRRLGCVTSLSNGAVLELSVSKHLLEIPDQLRDTIMHELAHLVDIVVDPAAWRKNGKHGSSWRLFARALGAEPKARCDAQVLAQVVKTRKKVVARCPKCGQEFHRLRRFPQSRTYRHNGCGGILTHV